MQCTLHIPHLIPPPQAAAVWRKLKLPQLKNMLDRSRYTRTPPADDAELAGELLGIARDNTCNNAHDSAHDGAMPLASLLAQADGLAADSGYWLCATPVHLQTRHHALVLADPAASALTAAESNALAATLAAHLRDEHIALHAPQPDQWYLRCDTAPALATTPLAQVIGHDVTRLLPRGADALRWHRLLTEMQMLLHAHAVNDAREAAGHAAVNSVWLWGGGTLPPRATTPFTAVWSDDPMLRALARHAGSAVEAATPGFPADAHLEGQHFFSWQGLSPLIRQGDLQAWGAAVTALERDWFQPLAAALKARRVDRARLVVNNAAVTHRFELGRRDISKIFVKNKYLQ